MQESKIDSAGAARIRLLIVDDHGIMRKALVQLLACWDHIHIAGDVGCSDDAFAVLSAGGVDLVLLDMTMPGLSGENLIRAIRSRYAGVAILVLSINDEAEFAQKALQAGASGYVTKGVDPKLLISAIEDVAGGGTFIDPGLAREIAFAVVDSVPLPHQALSAREQQIVRLVVHGMSFVDIGDLLGISRKTVATHKARAMAKLGFTKEVDLIRYAVQHGLID